MRHPRAVQFPPRAVPQEAPHPPTDPRVLRCPNDWQLTPDQWRDSARCVQVSTDRRSDLQSRAPILPGHLGVLDQRNKDDRQVHILLNQERNQINFKIRAEMKRGCDKHTGEGPRPRDMKGAATKATMTHKVWNYHVKFNFSPAEVIRQILQQKIKYSLPFLYLRVGVRFGSRHLNNECTIWR